MNTQHRKLSLAIRSAMIASLGVGLVAAPSAAYALAYSSVGQGLKTWTDSAMWTSSPAGTYPCVGGVTGDTALIASGTGTGANAVDVGYNTTCSINNLSLGNATSSNNTLEISGGSLTTATFVNVNAQAGNELKVSGGSLSVGSALTVSKALSLSSGSISAQTTAVSSGTVNMTGGSFHTAGTYVQVGTGNTTVSAGTFTATNYTQTSSTSSSTTVSGGTFSVSGTFSQKANLKVDNGTTINVGTFAVTGGSTNLVTSSDKISISTDYSNSAFGTGNSFNRLATVSGSGDIVKAAGTSAQQGLTGADIGGTTNGNATMAFGNFRVGDAAATKNYQVINTGTTGPAIRGAIQNTSLSDTRLSGTGTGGGVGSGGSNYTPNTGAGALATGSSTGSLGVTFNPTSAGSLNTQSVKVVDNFGDAQTLSLTGAAFNKAATTTVLQDVNFQGVHKGTVVTSAPQGVSNTAPVTAGDGYSPQGYTEKLALAVGVVSGNAGGGNAAAPSVPGLIAAGNSGNVSVGIDTSSVGTKSGSVQFTLASDGTGTSGLASIALGNSPQTVNVAATVYDYANAAWGRNSGGGSFTQIDNNHWTLNLGAITQNSTATQSLNVFNTLSSFVDTLHGVNFIGSGDFILTPSNWTTFTNNLWSGLIADINTSTLGALNGQIELVWDGFNVIGGGNWFGTSGGQNTTSSIFLDLTGTVVGVPEPGILWLFGSAGVSAWLNTRRKKAGKA